MRPGGIWQVGICGSVPGRTCPAPTTAPVFLLAKRPALLYNRLINNRRACYDC